MRHRIQERRPGAGVLKTEANTSEIRDRTDETRHPETRVGPAADVHAMATGAAAGGAVARRRCAAKPDNATLTRPSRAFGQALLQHAPNEACIDLVDRFAARGTSRAPRFRCDIANPAYTS
jgi:hypothetical protein